MTLTSEQWHEEMARLRTARFECGDNFDARKPYTDQIVALHENPPVDPPQDQGDGSQQQQ